MTVEREYLRQVEEGVEVSAADRWGTVALSFLHSQRIAI